MRSVGDPEALAKTGGVDFGWDHPFAAVELAHDKDTDTIYVTKATARATTPVIHAAALKPWGDWLHFAWPRDGKRETLEGAGVALAQQYTAAGLKMLSMHAQFDDKSVSVEAGHARHAHAHGDRAVQGLSDIERVVEEFRHVPPWREARWSRSGTTCCAPRATG